MPSRSEEESPTTRPFQYVALPTRMKHEDQMTEFERRRLEHHLRDARKYIKSGGRGHHPVPSLSRVGKIRGFEYAEVAVAKLEREIAAALELLDEQEDKAINMGAREGHPSPEIELIIKGLQVAGSAARLAEWMRTPVLSLDGQTPYSLMQTEEGRKQMDAVLTRIEHGVY